MSSLEERAMEIRARNKVLRSVKGSGYHDDDTNPVSGRLCAPHRRHLIGGELPYSLPQAPVDEHLVAFYDTRDVVFIGDDAVKVRDAVVEYAARVRKVIEEALASGQGIPQLPGTDWAVMNRIAPRMVIADGVLRVWREDWSDVLHVFDHVPLGTTGAPYANDAGP